MGTRLLCCVTLCLLGAGHTGAGVLQSPRHKVTMQGWNVTFRCDPISGHAGLYWYRQARGQGPEFLISFQNQREHDSSGMPKNDRFQAKRPEGTDSSLQIQRAEPGDSAVYLCASSLTTVGHSHLLPLHQPHALASHS
ncbi:TVB2 protein, partial [Crocuta crocuta]